MDYRLDTVPLHSARSAVLVNIRKFFHGFFEGISRLRFATDENEQHSVGISTTVGGVGITARSEQDIAKSKANGGTGAESEFGLSYTTGALSIAFSRDTGNNGQYGDEAETVTTVTYDLGGITLVGKATDKDETEVSAAFTF